LHFAGQQSKMQADQRNRCLAWCMQIVLLWTCPDLGPESSRRKTLADLIFVASTLLFFTVAWYYARGCNQL